MKVIKDNEVVELLCQMIEIPSFVDKDNNEKLLAYFIKDFFEKNDIDVKLDKVCEDRFNVIATVGSGDKTLLLTGHTDTVPLYGCPSLLSPQIRNNRVYGRGANDMKGALASMMIAMKQLKKVEHSLNGRVMFAGVIDEELSSLGTIDLIERNYRIDCAIVGEPTSLNLGIGHRGLEWVTFKSYGDAIHSGSRSGECNAIENMMVLFNNVKSMYFKESHELLGDTTINAGFITGGTQPSTVADYCELVVDFRYLPGQSFLDIKSIIDKEIKKLSEIDESYKFSYDIEERSKMSEGYYHDACYTDKNEEIITITTKVLEQKNRSSEFKSFTAWTDGGLLNSNMKIPVIILGPGDLRTAHSSEEYIEIDELIEACNIYFEICKQYLE